VPPGQKHRRATTWDELLAAITQGKYRGLILMSSYGFHRLSGSYKEHALYAGHREKFVEAFLLDRRNEEIAILKDVAAAAKSNPSKMWLLSVIAKQDLWYPKRVTVTKHYAGGEYAKEIAAVIAQNPHNDVSSTFRRLANTSRSLADIELGVIDLDRNLRRPL
jgi:hypothetical protein